MAISCLCPWTCPKACCMGSTADTAAPFQYPMPLTTCCKSLDILPWTVPCAPKDSILKREEWLQALQVRIQTHNVKHQKIQEGKPLPLSISKCCAPADIWMVKTIPVGCSTNLLQSNGRELTPIILMKQQSHKLARLLRCFCSGKPLHKAWIPFCVPGAIGCSCST